MRAGKLDREIQIMRNTLVDDGFGGQVPGDPEPVYTLRAQLIQASTEEFIREYGASFESTYVFRTRFLDDVSLADWIGYNGAEFNLKEIKPIGRRRGLEFRCVAR